MSKFNIIMAAINIILLVSNMQTRDSLNNPVITMPISQFISAYDNNANYSSIIPSTINLYYGSILGGPVSNLTVQSTVTVN